MDVTISKTTKKIWEFCLEISSRSSKSLFDWDKDISKAFMELQLQVNGKRDRSKNILKTEKVTCAKVYHWLLAMKGCILIISNEKCLLDKKKMH